jgi:hypothetical protein
MRCRPNGRLYRTATFGVMINRKKAQTVGLTMAHAMLFQADEVSTGNLLHSGGILPVGQSCRSLDCL